MQALHAPVHTNCTSAAQRLFHGLLPPLEAQRRAGDVYVPRGGCTQPSVSPHKSSASMSLAGKAEPLAIPRLHSQVVHKRVVA